MFLANLEDKEKRAFLNLAQILIASDGILNENEIVMVEQYKQEMNLHISSNESWEEDEKSIAVFKNSSVKVQKQIIFELVALACADKEYAAAEHTLLKKINNALGLQGGFIQECKILVEEVTGVYDKIGKLVGE